MPQGRSFFITKDGKFGFASARVQAGDDAAVLLGGEVSFVVRKFSKQSKGREMTWRSQRQRCCEGIMDGELFQVGREPKLQSIVLS